MLNISLDLLTVIMSAKKNIKLKYIDNLIDRNDLKYMNLTYFTMTININHEEIAEVNTLINE